MKRDKPSGLVFLRDHPRMPVTSQLRQSGLSSGILLCFLLATVAVCLLVSVRAGIPLADLTRDRSTVTGERLLAGILSQAGIMLWAAAAAVCILAACWSRSDATMRGWTFFFAAAGVITSQLCLDDAFLLHESIIPGYLHIPEHLVYAVYIAGTGWFLWHFRYHILSTEYIILAAALGLFTISVGLDKFLDFSNVETFVEDTMKFGGILFWLLYFSRTFLSVARRSETPLAAAQQGGGNESGVIRPRAADRK